MMLPASFDRTDSAASACFHCAQPIPAGTNLYARVADQDRAVCCHGCRAVAELVADAGLDDYYRFRTAPAATARADAAADARWLAFDQDSVLAKISRVDNDGVRTATLGLDGLGCAACGWLIDRMLQRLSGIVSVHVNAATARVTIRWKQPLTLSAILSSIAKLGYEPYPLDANNARNTQQDERRAALKRLAIAGFGMMQVMMFAWPLYGDGVNDLDFSAREYLRLVSLICTVPVLFYAGGPILLGAWRAARARVMVMDIPVAIALLLAFIASAWNTWRGSGAVYFDSVVMFVFFLVLGRFVEMRARHSTGSVTDALARLLPRTVHAVRGSGHSRGVQDIAIDSLALNDEVWVRTGEIVPIDGVILEGATRIDESMLTGESVPVAHDVGARVTAGTLNLQNPIRVRVTALGDATVLQRIVRLLHDAGARTQTQTAADKTAAWFLNRILIGAAAVAAGWLIVDPSKAFEATLAVLVVTCPCALSLALPTAQAAATAALARRGILIVDGTALETLSKITRVVFDKTGTLTRGRPVVTDCAALGALPPLECQRIAAALEAHSEHPLARAFARFDDGATTASQIETVMGAGIQGVVDGQLYRLGKVEFAARDQVVRHNEIYRDTGHQDAGSRVFLGDGQHAFASFRIADSVRDEAAAVVQALRSRSIASAIASGDALQPVIDTAKACGIEHYRARLSPQEKLGYVRECMAGGDVVAMVGDGVNDAPVLAGANVSIAMSRGSMLAHSTAQIVFVRDSLDALPDAIDMARKTARIVRQNLGWAVAYNFIALPLAALGFVPPWLAAVGMSLSSILVVANAMRLAPGAKQPPSHSNLECGLQSSLLRETTQAGAA